VVVAIGLTTTADPDKFPGIQTKLPPPLAFNTAEAPAHIVVELLTVIVGNGCTETVCVVVALHPVEAVPVTV